MWDESGQLVSETSWINGEEVSDGGDL